MNRFLTAVIVALLLGCGYGYHMYAAERAARVTAQLSLDSLEAVEDTTRQRLVGVLGDSVAYWERRVVQLNEANDSLGEALEQRTVAHNRAVARVDELETQVHGIIDEQATPSGETVPGAVFELRRPPYTVWARAVISNPPILNFQIQLDSIPLGIRLGCGLNDDLSKAYVGIRSPEWAQIRIVDAQQDDSICNPDLDTELSFWGKYGDEITIGTGIVAGAWVVKTLVDVAKEIF